MVLVGADFDIVLPAAFALGAFGFADLDHAVEQWRVVACDILGDGSGFNAVIGLRYDQQILQPGAVGVHPFAQFCGWLAAAFDEDHFGIEGVTNDAGAARLFQCLEHFGALAEDALPSFTELGIGELGVRFRQLR